MDFEILSLNHSSDLHSIQSSFRSDLRDVSCLHHGGCSQQESSGRRTFLCRSSMEEDPLQAAVDTSTDHSTVGKASATEGTHGRPEPTSWTQEVTPRSASSAWTRVEMTNERTPPAHRRSPGLPRSPPSPTWSSATPAEVINRDQIGDLPGLEIILGPNPICNCNMVTIAWVAYTPGHNHQRIFHRCPRQQGKQRRFFQWHKEDLLNDLRAWKYLENHQGQPRNNREILKAMIQDACPHLEVTKAGSNGYQTRRSCKKCQKVLEIVPKAPKPSQEELDLADYQQFLRFKETFKEFQKNRARGSQA